MYEPERTCVICRKKALKKELTRYFMPISKGDNEGGKQEHNKTMMLDAYKKSGGRGYYLCESSSCQEKFQKLKFKKQKSKKV